MKEYRVAFAPAALADLDAIERHVTGNAGPVAALDYVDRLQRKAASALRVGRIGTIRRSGPSELRTIGIERRVTVLFLVEDDSVLVLRMLYGGRDLMRALRRIP